MTPDSMRQLARELEAKAAELETLAAFCRAQATAEDAREAE